MCLPVDYAFAEGRDGDVLGQVLADGRVVDVTGAIAGFVQPDGTVRSADGVRVGSARRGAAVRGADGRLTAVVSEQGYVKAVGDGGDAVAGAQMSADGVLRAADGKMLGAALAPAPVPDAVVRCGTTQPYNLCPFKSPFCVVSATGRSETACTCTRSSLQGILISVTIPFFRLSLGHVPAACLGSEVRVNEVRLALSLAKLTHTV